MNARDPWQRIADLCAEIASPRPAHISEAFHAQHVAAAQASLDRLLDTTPTLVGEPMARSKQKHVGRCARRIEHNLEEKRFALAWRKKQTHGSLLAHLYGDGNRRGAVTDEQEECAATVIQWLGSHVGQCFLKDLGYTKDDR